MTSIEQFATINKLKTVKRGTRVGTRQESTAEHTFSAMVLAQYYLKRTEGLDELRVMKLLLYHDLVEIYAGDSKAWEGEGKIAKEKKEKAALKVLLRELPKELAAEVKSYVQEYAAASTMEAKFAHAIDNFDANIQGMNDPAVYKKYNLTVKFIKKLKGKYFEPFPILNREWERHLNQLAKRGILPKE